MGSSAHVTKTFLAPFVGLKTLETLINRPLKLLKKKKKKIERLRVGNLE
jgi:hypothetical protein